MYLGNRHFKVIAQRDIMQVRKGIIANFRRQLENWTVIQFPRPALGTVPLIILYSKIFKNTVTYILLGRDVHVNLFPLSIGHA